MLGMNAVEGGAIEPDQHYGTGFIDAIQQVFRLASAGSKLAFDKFGGLATITIRSAPPPPSAMML